MYMGQQSEELRHYRIKKKSPLYSLSVDNSEVCLPPLYIKLRLIKIFVQALDEGSEGFIYLR